MQPTPTLKRSLSLPLVTFYGIGTILGAGIYVLVGKVAGAAGMHTPVAFVLASLLILPSAFSYAELVARFPRSAGEAIYVQEGIGWPPLSVVVGLMIVSLGVLSTATLVHGLVGYLEVFLVLPDTAVIIAAVLILGVVVAWGISESVMLATLMTIVEIGGLLLIIWVARGGFAVLPAQAAVMVPGIDGTVWAGVMLGAFIAFYAYIGFEDMVNVAEEVKHPERNLPLAILAAWLVTTLLYLVVSTLCVLVVSPSQLASTDAPLALVYQHITGRAPVVITVISLVSILNGALIQIIMASRVLYGMSRQGWLPARLGRVNARTRTPLTATALVCVIILLFALWLPLLELAKLTSLVTLTVFTLVNLALWRIKARHGAAPGVRCVPYWVPVLGVCCSAGFAVYQAVRMATG